MGCFGMRMLNISKSISFLFIILPLLLLHL
ncbi:hypothetical protein CsSME_00011709 [Camellia sinensis var. sinensis]